MKIALVLLLLAIPALSSAEQNTLSFTEDQIGGVYRCSGHVDLAIEIKTADHSFTMAKILWFGAKRNGENVVVKDRVVMTGSYQLDLPNGANLVQIHAKNLTPALWTPGEYTSEKGWTDIKLKKHDFDESVTLIPGGLVFGKETAGPNEATYQFQVLDTCTKVD